MIEIAIGLGIVLSLWLAEWLGVTAGGIIVPGYIGMYMHEPMRVVATFLISLLVWGMVQGLSKYLLIYGRRRLVLSLLLGFFMGYISRNYIAANVEVYNLDFYTIGYIIPGLIASWMDRQGPVRTISVILIVATIVQLSVMLLSNGALHV
ncbi:MAG TPA: poly-gamma-glutamate biosynthesis protein PgsC [Candidatus Marinimicrobia bacterium]|nr:MAG: poly-gamma-glutamate biosynthesis protein PgsC [Candidatus Marinimicrobia bacterium CG1_02_48_14]PJA51772.1 MAG: poly-gamma-glutamate biosynthesis protein PgsC [Candidatus Marinimicrobia bacterium CG_4_9_14_3_um_filter_48_9]HCW77338.1 poly-gamma-glutamate biosynthesis protein PgsC [Candidatus Neomarinimicrobiota bacterium]